MKTKTIKITEHNLCQIRNELEYHSASLTLSLEREHINRIRSYACKLKDMASGSIYDMDKNITK